MLHMPTFTSEISEKIEVLDFHKFPFHKWGGSEDVNFWQVLYLSNFNSSDVMKQNITMTFPTVWTGYFDITIS